MHRPSSSHTTAITAHLAGAGAQFRALTGTLRGRRPEPTTAGPSAVVRSEARVLTDRSARYAKQLCSHAARMTARAQWNDPHGVIDFPGGTGTCRITAEANGLHLVLEAAESADLARWQQVIGDDIERFASREGLTVRWTPQ